MRYVPSERLGPVPPDKLTAIHRAAIAAFKDARGADVFGPFVPLLWSPELMVRAGAVGDYLRYHSALPPHLSELVILVTARLWSQQYEWSLHGPIALEAGIDPAVVDAIAAGRRPQQLSEAQEIVYDLATEVIDTRAVSDETFDRAMATLGEKGVIDAVSLTGYYSWLAMILNTARTSPVPGGPLLPPLGR
jgi:4-carboxymuconolactone decarboxylase